MCAPMSLKWLLRTEIFGKDTKNMREICFFKGFFVLLHQKERYFYGK